MLRAGLALCVVLAGCAPKRDPLADGQVVYDPTLGLHVSRNGTVYPSASANVAGVTVGASSGGGYVGTRFGPIRLSAGF
ncbi:hypothetical protein [Pseudogemmobacter bohemicus]|uniref:hypothetical protein n=1 Tax=Pseudogemmobacter bohemicus TaxID=2250708 RepID=UPI000DD2DC0D|nr:hypothetical protein [Pseudogemmobacter bohemicus]